jgi:hypothetical protein
MPPVETKTARVAAEPRGRKTISESREAQKALVCVRDEAFLCYQSLRSSFPGREKHDIEVESAGAPTTPTGKEDKNAARARVA